jgi:hypothetical protein
MTDEEARKIVDEVEHHKRNFMMCFGGPAGQQVLIYLNRYCHAAKSSIVIDSDGAVDMNHTLINEGKRRVFLEILTFLNLSPEQVFNQRYGISYPTGEATNE